MSKREEAKRRAKLVGDHIQQNANKIYKTDGIEEKHKDRMAISYVIGSFSVFISNMEMRVEELEKRLKEKND